MGDTCSNKRLQEIIKNQGKTIKKVNKFMEKSIKDIHREDEEEARRMRDMLL